MYTVNSLVHGWWEKVTLIIWGAPAKLAAEDKEIQSMIKDAIEKGVRESAEAGVLAGYPVVDVKVRLYDAYHKAKKLLALSCANLIRKSIYLRLA